MYSDQVSTVSSTPHNEISLKRAVLKDISIFINSLTTSDHLDYESFRLKWTEMDLDLLFHFTSPETVLSCLIQLGLFGPTRPFRDHRILIFFLFSMYRCTRKPLSLSVDRIQFLLGIKMQARMLDTSKETLDALEALFNRDAFIIIADDTNNNSTLTPVISNSNASIEQILDRIRRIELFLSSHPLFDQKFHRTGILRLKTLFDRYYDAKRKACISLQEEQDFGAVLDGVMKVIEGYEKLVSRSSLVSPPPSSLPKSIRSRLSQNSLTPIAPAALPDDLFSGRAQSVPPVTRIRRSSSMRGVDLDEFMTNTSTTNMPDINFY